MKFQPLYSYIPIGRYIGTKAQVKYVANQAINLPVGDEIAQLHEVGADFIQELSVISDGTPELRMICYNQQGIDALVSWGETSFVDGTFNVRRPISLILILFQVLEGGRILTLLLVRAGGGDGEGFICAWMVR